MNPNLTRTPKFKLNYPKLLEDAKALPEIEQNELFRELCLTDMYFLLRYGCGIPAHVMDLPFAVDRCAACDERLASPTGMHKWLIMVFRGGFKSTCFNQGVHIQQILSDPEESGCIFSHNKSLAIKHLNSVKRVLEESDNLKIWFPDILYENPANESKQWSEQGGIIVKRKGNPKEPTLSASGLVSGMPTGMHFNRLCFDDVVTRDNVVTLHGIEETVEAYRNALNLVPTDGYSKLWIWALGTFYRYGDAYCKMLDDGIYKFEKIPWIDSDGNYHLHTEEAAADKIKMMGRYEIATQMMLDPVPSSDMTFDSNAIEEYNPAEVERMSLKTFLMADLATKKKESRNHNPDMTAMWVLGKDIQGNEYFLDGVYDRINRPDAIGKMLKLVKKYNVQHVLWEQTAAQEDENFIKREQASTGIRFKLESFNPTGKKEDRIIGALHAAIESGLLKFPPQKGYHSQSESKIIDLMAVLRKEMREFPMGHDDFLDCGAQRNKLPAYGRSVASRVKLRENRMSNPGRATGVSSNSLLSYL